MSEEETSDQRDDGLAQEYDFILLGTGLVQAILSCVASKHGKRVLHLESNDYYGEDYSCHHLSGHLAHYSDLIARQEGVKIQHWANQDANCWKLNASPQEGLVTHYIDTVSAFKGKAAARFPFKASVSHPASFGYAMEHEEPSGPIDSQSPIFHGYVTNHHMSRARVWLKDRDFNIDTTAKVLYGSCPMVELMVASGVSNYLEFRTFEGLYFWLQSGTATGSQAAADHNGKMWKVPCSRNDVFNTTVLSALEKRALMKFHQFVADWGRAQVGTEVTSLNEVELAVGRSLYRPQNKQLTFAGFNVDAFIDRPFVEFLDDCKMSKKLQNIVIYALCCHNASVLGCDSRLGRSESYTTKQGLSDMFMHIDSIGRFGETAFLSPLYGSSEVVQAFCRMSAVWGGTFILRRSVTDVQLAIGDASQAEDAEGGAANQPRNSHRLTVVDSEGNSIRCGAFVCSAGYWPSVPTKRCAVLSCTSVWLGAVVAVSRSVIIIPPALDRANKSAAQNSHAVHILQTDSSTNAAPEGAVVLHISTILDFDERCAGGTWREQAEASSPRATSLVDTVLGLLLSIPAGESTASASAEATAPQELSRVVALKPVYDLPSASEEAASSLVLPPNVQLCTGASDAALSMQSAYDQARSIFERIFPDLDFTLGEVTPLPEESQQHMTNPAETDDEAVYLEFALSSATSAEPTEDPPATVHNNSTGIGEG